MTDADRSARTPQKALARLRTGVSVAEPPAGHDYVPFLGWFKVWQRGQRVGPPPAGLSPDALKRRRFAERLADTFAYPDAYAARYGHGGDLAGASSAFVPVEVSPLAQRVIVDAEKVTEKVMTTPGETRVYTTGSTDVDPKTSGVRQWGEVYDPRSAQEPLELRSIGLSAAVDR